MEDELVRMSELAWREEQLPELTDSEPKIISQRLVLAAQVLIVAIAAATLVSFAVIGMISVWLAFYLS